jgi:Protein phosphatase 2C
MAAAWRLRWRSFALPRDGNTPEEYEDALAANPRTGRFAVADGASESSFAGMWAKLLVDGFVASGDGRTTVGWVKPLQHRWAEAVDPLELDWFAEEKRQLGAFATFLGLSLKKPHGSHEGRWKAVAVGDSCIFQVRADALLIAFPVRRSGDFGNRPALLGSRSVATEQIETWSQAGVKIGSWQSGDRFLLMTDAAAEWFLRRHEAKRKPWQSLLRRFAEPNTTAALATYVKELWRAGELKNDDVTLLVIEL